MLKPFNLNFSSTNKTERKSLHEWAAAVLLKCLSTFSFQSLAPLLGNSFISHPRPTWMKLGISLKSQILPLTLDSKKVNDLQPLCCHNIFTRSWQTRTRPSVHTNPMAWMYCSIWKFMPSAISQGKFLKDKHSVLLMSNLMTNENRAWWAGVSTNAQAKRPSNR